MPRMAADLPPVERAFLLNLQARALRYFLDNQMVDGLVLDRQSNFGPRRCTGWRSTATTGMGLIALALASSEPYRLLTPAVASARIRSSLKTAFDQLPHRKGIMPHFTDAKGLVVGFDVCSTVDSAWLVAGGLWAALFLRDGELQDLAERLFRRIDWRYWTTPSSSPHPGLIRHASNQQGQLLPCVWDRLNGETVFLYVLAAGADRDRAWPADAWSELQPFFGTAAGLRFISADLGLFVFQYGLDLLDIERYREPGGLDLKAQAMVAAEANFRCCRDAADEHETYRHYWGLSAGDGPGEPPGADTYRCYAPGQPLDGTAHLTATLASIAHQPALVLDNLLRARNDRGLCSLGRYGFSSVNLDRRWIASDMVGIDAGAAVLALDNFLADHRVQDVFHQIPCVRQGLDRIGFARVLQRHREENVVPARLAS